MKQAVRQLLDDLDVVLADHGEMGETDVREAMWLMIRNVLLVPQPGYQIPQRFEMATDQGDAAVARALSRFLNHPEVIAVARSTMTAEQRLAAFRDESVHSTHGGTLNSTIGLSDCP